MCTEKDQVIPKCPKKEALVNAGDRSKQNQNDKSKEQYIINC